jgi:hypothetical protein
LVLGLLPPTARGSRHAAISDSTTSYKRFFSKPSAVVVLLKYEKGSINGFDINLGPYLRI